jgi:hypothetical protein
VPWSGRLGLSDDKISSSLIGDFNPAQSSNGGTNWIIREFCFMAVQLEKLWGGRGELGGHAGLGAQSSRQGPFPGQDWGTVRTACCPAHLPSWAPGVAERRIPARGPGPIMTGGGGCPWKTHTKGTPKLTTQFPRDQGQIETPRPGLRSLTCGPAHSARTSWVPPRTQGNHEGSVFSGGTGVCTLHSRFQIRPSTT